ncbi:MAG TPA: hypothetical protein VNW24_09200 [Stellaceae bacterium]|nr:hypothetical protein [Stellaceae bacterium]
MSSVPTLSTSTTSIMNVLTQAALNNAAAQESYRFQLIQTQLNNQFQEKIAALKASNDTSAKDDFLKVQISYESQQKATFSTLQTQYGANANILADITTQITALQNAAGAGDSATFDGALATANADVSFLTVVQDNPAVQPDGIAQLKTGGLGVQPSASYNLSTTAGQTAALAALQNAANLINQAYSVTTSNQTIAGSAATALDSKISGQDSTVQNDQLNQTAAVALKTLQLKQQLTTQLHLIELSFANAQSAGASLQQQELAGQAALEPAPPGTIFSLFG